MPDIHPTALVDAAAKLADDVAVGPYSVIGPDVTIGAGTTVGAHCVIENHTTIGAQNRIFHHATLGQEPQDLKYHGENATLVVGDHNDIREHATLHIGTENGGGSTTVGSHNLLMAGSHVAHDSHLADHVILANNVLLAGHVIVEKHAIVSGGTAVSHFVTIGEYGFIGGLAGVVHDCPPYMISDGHPARVRGVNLIGLQRHQFDDCAIEALKDAYRTIFKKQNGDGRAEVLAELEEKHTGIAAIEKLIEFLRRADSGIHGRYAEAHRADDKRAKRPK